MNKVCSDRDVSIRGARQVLAVNMSTYHYRSQRRKQTDPEHRVKQLVQARMRLRYRRVHFTLQSEAWMTSLKRTYRLYTASDLQLRNKTPDRWVKAKLGEDGCPTLQPNQTWAMNFDHDPLAIGKKIRILTLVDIFSKFTPVVQPRLCYCAEEVVRTLEWN